MVTITLLVSGLLVATFGYLVVEWATRDLLRSAQEAAEFEVSQGVGFASSELNWHSQRDDPELGNSLRRIMSTLGRSRTGTVVALVPPEDIAAERVAPAGADFATALTGKLVAEVKDGHDVHQIVTATVEAEQGPVTYLVYGRPLPTRWGGQFELYYLFPLTDEADLATDLQGTLLATGVPLVLLLVVVTGLVTRLVVRPVRLAARAAQRLSAGLLDQRMAVRGEDDLALLAASLNQMAANLQRQIVALEEMSRQQRRFTSDVSHELRTPLTTVRMAADLIFAERDSYPPAVARSAELLQHELDRFEGLLTDLLEVSRFDAGFAALDAEPTDLTQVVRRAADRLGAVAARAGTEVRVSVPDQPVIAEVDPRRVDRVLRNLIGNAVEHGAGRLVQVTLAGGRTAVAVTVRDHGRGLAPGEDKLVFGRFWRADASRARQTGGTGLGLSISLEDARLHGGWLEAWGAPGRGAQFRLTLPVRAGDRIASSPLPLEPVAVAGSGPVDGPAPGGPAPPGAADGGGTAGAVAADGGPPDGSPVGPPAAHTKLARTRTGP